MGSAVGTRETPHVDVSTAVAADQGTAELERRLALPTRKVFWDPVHGEISLHPVSVAIVDTPQFQRLRHIRQLGLVSYVYPGASHSRFEHSLGTAHLARLLGARLRDNQPELSITEKELLCLEVAGLCHDLGHGPFSHIWERFYHIGARDRGVEPAFSHEAMSCKLLEHLISVNGLQEVFDDWEFRFGQGLTVHDVQLIQDLILAKVGRAECSRRFLFEIVSNCDSGLDVDKWDYYLRDCHAVGVTCGFQYERLLSSARVVQGQDGSAHVAFRDKELGNVYEMFRTRSRLHHSVYRHHFVEVVDAMVCDAIRLADEKTDFIIGGNRRRLSLWQTTHDAMLPEAGQAKVEEFAMLTDSVVELSVRHAAPSDPDVLQAQKLWNALDCRVRKPYSLYSFLGSVPYHDNLTAEEVQSSLLAAVPEAVRPPSQDLLIYLVNVHWGRGKEDPVKNVLFYRKSQPDVPMRAADLQPVCSAHVLPSQFHDLRWHLILRTQAKPGFEGHLHRWLANFRTAQQP